jgi:hypothetical protein
VICKAAGLISWARLALAKTTDRAEPIITAAALLIRLPTDFGMSHVKNFEFATINAPLFARRL